MSNNDYSCCVFTSIIIFLTSIGIFVNYSSKYYDSLKYELIKCNITDVEYPTKIPETIEDYNNNFVKCNCGKRCVSDMGICSKIFITDKHYGKILLQNKYNLNNQQCTFKETRCNNGEKIKNRINAINDNINNMKKYESYINNSKLIDCYEFNDIYFLDDYNHYTEFVIASSFLGLLILILILILLYKYCS